MYENDLTEEDTKQRYIAPALKNAGWEDTQIRYEYPINAGQIENKTSKYPRKPPERVDYLLRYKENINLAVIEAKKASVNVTKGIQQAKSYANKLGLRFAFSTNGKECILCDLVEGTETPISLENFPSPTYLFNKQYEEDIHKYPNLKTVLDTPYYYSDGYHEPRYYQTLAINKTVEAIAKGQKRLMLVMATGTGKTYMAFQIIYRLWKSKLKRKILYLADRNVLLDQTIHGDFKPFNNKGILTKISHKKFDNSYEIYLSLYQQLSENNVEDPLELLKKNFNPDFFDFVIIDECHRGSARDDSNWRRILDYFAEATHLGLTATPKESKDVSNIDYFGEPIYEYSLKQGIEDGFLAPYKIKRVFLNVDITGYRPKFGERDELGYEIPDVEYSQKDIDRKIIILERDKEVARVITEHLKKTDRFAKTIVFCVDIDHAERLRKELVNLNSDLIKDDWRYIMKITGDDKEGKKELENFIDPRSKYPTIVTTSKLLTTGVNCPTCKNIVLDIPPNESSKTEFKQIIGRGTRISEKYDKYSFTILDFRGATKVFEDIDFDGTPIQVEEYKQNKINASIEDIFKDESENLEENETEFNDNLKHKYVVKGRNVEVIGEQVQIYENGRLINYSLKDFVKNKTLEHYKELKDFVKTWIKEEKRKDLINKLYDQGIFLKDVREKYYSESPTVDDFDIVLNLVYDKPLLTKFERANSKYLRKTLNKHNGICYEILNKLVDKYAHNQIEDLCDIQNLKTPDFKQIYGNLTKIIEAFNGKEKFLEACSELKTALYI